MMRMPTIIAGVLALGLALVLGYKALASRYLQPRAALIAQIEGARARLDAQREGRQDAPRVAGQLKQIVDRTLGGDLETVDHKLRMRLSRLRERVGLVDDASNTGTSIRKLSPARRRFSQTPSLRDEIDFIELAGSVNGQGSFEQALALIASIEAEPWIKRIDEVRLDPADNGARFNITVKLTTLFLPGRLPDPSAPIPAMAAPADRYAMFASVNPFRIPPPPPPDAPPPEASPAPPVQPPGFDYQQWSITGVARGNSQPEVWLLNSHTRETRIMVVGQSIHDAALTAVHEESAEFQIGDQRFAVQIGRNLGDRQPIGQ